MQINKVRKLVAIIGCVFGCAASAPALELVKDGSPVAEIVLAEDALPQVKLAALELRDHVKKMIFSNNSACAGLCPTRNSAR